jgi:cyclic beta-1,2-glucan synthetase
MRIDPVIPGWWQGFRVSYRHGEALYEIQVENPQGLQHGVSCIEMDGRRMLGEVITLDRTLVKHRVLVRMGELRP